MNKTKVSKWKQRQNKKYEKKKKGNGRFKIAIGILIMMASIFFIFVKKRNVLIQTSNITNNNEKQQKIENRMNNYDMELFNLVRIKPEAPIDFENIEEGNFRE